VTTVLHTQVVNTGRVINRGSVTVITVGEDCSAMKVGFVNCLLSVIK